jgi:quinol monooxygenase YgiN
LLAAWRARRDEVRERDTEGEVGGVFGLMVRFTCKDEAAAAGFDELVARTGEQIRANEPGTVIYAVHRVDGRPLERVFYELYRDREAFEAHEVQDYVKAFLEERDLYLASTEVDWLELVSGKGVDSER